MSFSVDSDDIKPIPPRRNDRQDRSDRTRDNSTMRDDFFENIQAHLGRDFTGGNIDQRTGVVQKWLTEVLVNINSRFKEGVLTQVLINKEDDLVRYPSIVLGIDFNDNGVQKFIGHAWLMENPDDPLELLDPVRDGTQQYDRQPVPASVYDEDYEAAISKRARQVLGNEELLFINAGVTPIHKYFNLDNPNDLLALLYTTIASLTSFRGYEVGDYTKMMAPDKKSGNSAIVARVDMGAAIEYDELDLPIRADWSIVLTETPMTNRDDRRGSRGYNSRDQAPTTFAEVIGFTNILYTAPDEEARKPRNYIPEFRITGINAPKIIPSLETMLFAIGSTAILNSDSLWVEGFTPRNTQHSPRRDIGALSLELPLEDEKIGRKTTFTPSERSDDYYNFIDYAFSDLVAHSLECPLAGPTSWLTDNFVRAAEEQEGRRAAGGQIGQIDALGERPWPID